MATYNVHDCVGRDGRFGPGHIAEVLVEIDPDVFALQEITLGRAGDLTGASRRCFDVDLPTVRRD